MIAPPEAALLARLMVVLRAISVRFDVDTTTLQCDGLAFRWVIRHSQMDTSGNWRRAVIRDSLSCGDVLGGWA